MTNNERDALLYEIIGDAHCPRRITPVVTDGEKYLLPQNATLCVKIVHRLLCAAFMLSAEWRQFTTHRTGNADHDLIAGRPRCSGRFRPGTSTSRSK